MELGGKADIPSSTARQVSPQFSQRGFLPRRSYDSMPGKEVLMAENSIRPARWGDPPPVGPAMRGGPSRGGLSFHKRGFRHSRVVAMGARGRKSKAQLMVVQSESPTPA